MPVHTLPAAQALARLATFDAIIDARTEDGEFLTAGDGVKGDPRRWWKAE